MCNDRFKEGKIPACVENCPAEALSFGSRRDMIELARQRIYESPDDYVHEIYGEHDAGGTSYLYLSSVPFEELAMRTDLGTVSVPTYSKGFLYSVPFILLLWPAFLYGLSKATGGTKSETEEE
jgi:hypothetical protein